MENTEAAFLQESQPVIFKQLQKSCKHGEVAHAYLFEGESGTGKKEMARYLAQCLLCQVGEVGVACEKCHNCRRVAAGEHPDVVELAPEGQSLKVEQIRFLKNEFTRSGLEGRQKVFIIHEAEKMTLSAANGLLKFLEEPEGTVCAILLTEAKARILPTIQSRCQVLHFQTLPRAIFLQKLKELGISENQGRFLLGLTNSLSKAVEFSQDEWFNGARDCIMGWFQTLRNKDRRAFVYVQSKVLPVFKEKQQQSLGLDLLLVCYQQQLEKQVHAGALSRENLQTTTSLQLILEARKKLDANVAFQSVCEQLALKLLAL